MPTPEPRDFLPLTGAQFHVMVALATGEMHGYAIMQAVESSSDGVVKMGPATLYGTIKKLVETRLAEEVPAPAADADPRRRYYRLTGLGREVCAAEATRLAGLARVATFHLKPGTA